MADETKPGAEVTGANAADASNAPQQPAQPLATPVSPRPPAPQANIPTDIAQLLKDIKIPEHEGKEVPAQPQGQAPALGVLPQYQSSAAPAPQPVAATLVPPQAAALGTNPAHDDVGAQPIVSLHTMKNDIQDVVRERKISAVRAAAIQQDSRREAPELIVERPRGTGRKIMLILTAVLLLLGLGGVAIYATYTLTSRAAPSTIANASQALIFAENQITLPLANQSPAGLKQALGGLLVQQATVGTITQIIPTVADATAAQGQRPATLSEFLNALGAQVPPELLRALSDQFFFGLHMADSPAPLFIIPVTSYDRAFPGMLKWETTIDNDLSPLFKQVPAVAVSPTGGLPVPREFKDLVVRNYDVRGLEDDTGAQVLYYSFPTPSLLIIAASPYTFPEVLSRLQAERKL